MTPNAKIEVIGSRRTIKRTASVDTGFEGDLCIPTRVAVQLGLELIGHQRVELADGSRKVQLVFGGSVRFFGETREVRIMLTDSADALIGTDLLEHYPIAIVFPGGRVKLQTRRKTGGGRQSG